jgi:hypothetical protein
MKTAALLLLLTAAAHAAMDKVPTEKMKTFCDAWIDAQDNPPKVQDYTVEEIKKATTTTDYANRCQAFINGVSNEMMGELAWTTRTSELLPEIGRTA